MEETQLESDRSELGDQLRTYVRERMVPHPLLAPYLADASILLTGSVAYGTWDEDSSLDLRLILPDEEHSRLAAGLQEAHLWEPGRDFRVSLRDREPFRRFPTEPTLTDSYTGRPAFRSSPLRRSSKRCRR